MSLRRSLNSEGIAHSNADSLVHARHVRQRKERRGMEWTGAAAPEHAADEFRLRADGLGLGNGMYFGGFGVAEVQVAGVEFEKHLAAVNWSRRFYFGSMRRGDKVCTVRRKLKSPACGEFIVNFSPAQMVFVNKEVELWKCAGVSVESRAEMLTALVSEIRAEVVGEFSRATGRDVVGSYVHFDSNKIHIGIVHSGVSEANKQVGEKCLGTVGAWSTAQNRLSKLGLVDAGDHRLKENLEKFHARFGEDRQPPSGVLCVQRR